MDLTQVSAKIRPRNHYEAIDLGCIMARHWAKPLYTLWFLTSLPLFIILQLLLPSLPYISILIIWWIKPLLESLQLLYVSEKLFSKEIQLKQILKKTHLRFYHNILAKLTLRRLSPSRSFDMPVSDLENLSGSQRNKRLNILQRSASSESIWLTITGIVIENILIFAFFGFIWMFIPSQLDIRIDFIEVLTQPEIHRMLSWCWYLAMGMVSPFYVTAGFSLYINRRTVLEGWDIELAFRDMAQRITRQFNHIQKSSNRLSKHASHLCICLLWFTFAFQTNSSQAASQTQSNSTQSNLTQLNLSQLNPSKRAPGKPISDLTPYQAQQRIITIMESEAFNDIRFDEGWRLKKSPKEPPPQLGNLIITIAKIAEVLLWGLAIVCVLYIILRLKGVAIPFFEKKRNINTPPPTSLFGLDLNRDSFPDDIINTAKSYWSKSPRQAYSLLYRAALSDLVHIESLALHSSYTEAECVRLLSEQSQDSPKINFFQTLTEQWITLAYGHKKISQHQFSQICQHWPNFFITNVSEDKGRQQ